MIECMRTNVVLNEALVEEALRLSGARSKRAVIEEALRVYVDHKAAEKRRESYGARLAALERRTGKLALRQAPGDLLRSDRERI